MCQLKLVAVSGLEAEGASEQHHERSLMSGPLQPPRSLCWPTAGVVGDFVNRLNRKNKKEKSEKGKHLVGGSSSVTSCKQLGVLSARDKSKNKTATTNKKKKKDLPWAASPLVSTPLNSSDESRGILWKRDASPLWAQHTRGQSDSWIIQILLHLTDSKDSFKMKFAVKKGDEVSLMMCEVHSAISGLQVETFLGGVKVAECIILNVNNSNAVIAFDWLRHMEKKSTNTICTKGWSTAVVIFLCQWPINCSFLFQLLYNANQWLSECI